MSAAAGTSGNWVLATINYWLFVCCIQLELLARREHLEEQLKCSRQQKVDRTLQMLAVAAEKQHLAKVCAAKLPVAIIIL